MASDNEGDPPAYQGTWPHSTMETIWPTKDVSVEDACEVIVTAEDLSFNYDDKTLGPVVYHGVEQGAGHWRVRAAHGATGTLHAFRDGEQLEGHFTDRGSQGMWIFTLSDVPDDA